MVLVVENAKQCTLPVVKEWISYEKYDWPVFYLGAV